MKKHVFPVIFIMLAVGVSVLYAQSNANLKSGVYRYSGIYGEASVIIRATGSQTRKEVTLHAVDGSVAARGTARIVGSRVDVDYDNQGFETWTIIDAETFTDDNTKMIWRWVRSYKNSEL
jgi:hypothetical protein